MSCERFDFSESNDCSHASVGKDFLFNVLVSDGDGDVEDISNDTFELVIKDEVGGATLLTLSNTVTPNATGFYYNDAVNGDMDMVITDTDSITVGEGVWQYEWNRTDSNGLISLEGYGTFQFIDRRV